MTEIDFRDVGDSRTMITQELHEIIESKTIHSFAKMVLGIKADNVGECNSTRTELSFDVDDQDITVNGEDGHRKVTLEFRGSCERRQLIEGLRWMADRLEAIK